MYWLYARPNLLNKTIKTKPNDMMQNWSLHGLFSIKPYGHLPVIEPIVNIHKIYVKPNIAVNDNERRSELGILW